MKHKIFKIIFWIWFSFLFIKIFFYLDKVPNYIAIWDKYINNTQTQIEKTKPKIKEIEQKIDKSLSTVKPFSKQLIAFWKILDRTIFLLDEMMKNLKKYDKTINDINPALEKINNVLLISVNFLKSIQTSLNTLEKTTKSVNFKLSSLDKLIQGNKSLLLNFVWKNINFVNSIFKIHKKIISPAKKVKENIETTVEKKAEKNINKLPNDVKNNIPFSF